MKIVKIIPSVLTSDPEEVRSFLDEAQDVAKRIQIDIIDGVFSNGKTIEPILLKDYDLSFEVDYHLMVKDPINWVEKCVTGQGDRIIGEVEMMNDQMEFIKKVQAVGLEVGLALDLETSPEVLSDEVLQSLDVVLLMSRKAGFEARTFELSTFDKIKEIVNKRNILSHRFKICIDGGVTDQLIADLAKAGVDEAIVGRKIFEGDLAENIKELAEY